MRIAFDYRILSLDHSVMTRGIPRHTQQQLRELLRIDTANEYVLLHPPGADTKQILPEIAAAPNLSLQPYPWSDQPYGPPEDAPHVLRKTEALQVWLEREGIDVYHTPAAWLSVEALFPAIDACAVVTTLYDLIPLLFAELFPLPDEFWQRRFHSLHWSTRLVAISGHTKQDAIRYLDIPADRIDVAHPVVEPVFDVLPVDEIERRLARLRRTHALPGQFLMTVTFVGFATKNVELLLEAYARLPPSLRRAYPLVSVGHFGPPHDRRIRSLLERLGISDDVRITGVVSDDELAAFYNAATAMIVPSRYEGFGFPVAEAMRCGAPVIASNASSFPEVAGCAGLLVEPDDAGGLARAIQEVVENPDLRARMRADGLRQAQMFTGERLARALLASFERAVADHARNRSSTSPRRIAVWTALPPQPDPAARTGLELVESLAPHATLELFVDEATLPAAPVMRAHRAHHYGAFERRHAQLPFDAIVYHPGGLSIAMHQAVMRHADRVVLSCGDGALACDLPLPSVRAVVLHDRPHTGADASRLHAIPPGVRDARGLRPEVEREAARARLALSPTTTAVSVVTGNGDIPDTALDAVASITSRLLDVQLLVACPSGSTPNAGLQARLEQRQLHHHVRWARSGTAGHDDDYLLAADLVVGLGGTTAEAIPTALARVLSIGRPLVVIGAIWPCVTADACRAIPESGDAMEIAAAMLTVVLDPDRQRAMSEAARECFERHMTLDRMGESYRAVIDAIGRRTSVAPSVTEAIQPRAAALPAAGRLPFNKACELEDFADPELAGIMREVLPFKAAHFGARYPRHAADRKDWEIAMAVRALRTFGALHPAAEVLGVAAGMEDTIGYLSTVVRQVCIVDRYLQSDWWEGAAPAWMLAAPGFGARGVCRPDRIRVEHMDGRLLRFPDDTFDGIFSSGSIEHFGGLLDVAHAAYEMGRVLKPGGVLTLSTELLLRGPAEPAMVGVPGLLMLRPAQIRRYIVEASGLEMVDDLITEVSAATRATRQGLLHAGHTEGARRANAGIRGTATADLHKRLPYVTVELDDVAFGSVHLTLRKPTRRTVVRNQWARPSPALDRELVEERRDLIAAHGSWPSQDGPVVVPTTFRARIAEMAWRVAAVAERGINGRRVARRQAAGWESEARRLASEGQTSNARAAVWQPGWTAVTVRPRRRPAFDVVVDRHASDIVGRAFLDDDATEVNAIEAEWLLRFVRAGDTVVDLGAHVGSLTFPLAAAGCHVLAVEASATNAALLRAGVARNGFRHVRVVHAAADETAGTTMFVSDGAQGFVAPPGTVAGQRVTSVRVDDLLDLVAWDRVALVKLDVQGSELRALSGLSRCLARADGPVLFYESSTLDLQRYGRQPRDITAWLEGLGYRCYRIDGRRLQRVRPHQRLPPLADHLAARGRLTLPGITVDEQP